MADVKLKVDAGVVNARKAKEYSQDSEAHAIGKRGGVDVASDDPTYHNNAKYYSEQASSSATSASSSASSAASSKSDSEAYAIGKRNGTDVTSGDAAYHNNSKYYAIEAWGYAGDASNAKVDAESAKNAAASSKLDSEAYAVGKRNGTDVTSGDAAYHNNSKYYADQAEYQADKAYDYKDDAKDYKDSASDYKNQASTFSQKAESWANGQKNGVDVGSSDQAYHNNSKYYKEEAYTYYVSSANRAKDSEAYAIGKRSGVDVASDDSAYHNNSKYYKDQTEAAATQALSDITSAKNTAVAAVTAAASDLVSDLADVYSSSSTYAKGEYCLYNGQLYICNTAITTAEAWNSAHWTAVTVGEELTDLKEDIDDLGFSVVNGKLCVTYTE